MLREGADRDRALIDIQAVLRNRFGVEHATVQIEMVACAESNCADAVHAVAVPLTRSYAAQI